MSTFDFKALVSLVPEDNISLTLSQNQLTVQNTVIKIKRPTHILRVAVSFSYIHGCVY